MSSRVTCGPISPHCIALVWLLSASSLLADGFIYVHPSHQPPVPPHVRPIPRPRRAYFPMQVTRHKVTIEVEETVARTRVEETFFNPNQQQLEGTYLFPLPAGAAVSDFAMKVGGQEVHGEILQKDKARRIYQDIVRQAKDPGLLEYVDRGLFRARVFPIPARGGVDVSLEYSESFRREHGTATYRYPLDTGKYISGGYKNVVIDAKLKSSLPIRSVTCPGYDAVQVKRASDREARISLEAKTIAGEKDFVFTWNVSEDALAPVVLAHRSSQRDGFFYLTIAPRPPEPGAVAPKDVVFIIDTSGSMMGKKIEQVRKALQHGLARLRDTDRFNIVDFATEANQFREAPVPASPENRKAASAYVDAMRARGGTNLEEAIRLGLSLLKPDDRLGMAVLLTDGEPTIGVVTPQGILETLRAKNPQKRRVFVFGVGDDLNAKLLDAIAKESRATTQYIRSEENLEVPLSNFFDKIDSPVLTDLTVAFPGGGVRDLYPRPLPDLFRGEQLEVFGRYGMDGKKPVVLRGTYQGKARVFEYSLAFEASSAHAFIPRLWAMRKVGYLLEQVRLSGETAEVKNEVVRLSKRYGIITPYTSYLIIEDARLTREGGGRSPAAGGARPDVQLAVRDAIVAAEPAADGEKREEKTLAKIAPAAKAFGRASGSGSVSTSRRLNELKSGARGSVQGYIRREVNRGGTRMKEIGGRVFYLQGTRWVDGALLGAATEAGGVPRKSPDAKRETVEVTYLSDAYFKLLDDEPGIGVLLSAGGEVTFLWKGKVIQVTPEKVPGS